MQTLSVHAGYYDLLTWAGLNVLGHERFGKGRGDILFAVERSGDRGIVIVGYGSCSGCDILASAKPPPGMPWDPEKLAFIEIFARELAATVHWGNRTLLSELLHHPDYALMRWYGHEADYPGALDRILELMPE